MLGVISSFSMREGLVRKGELPDLFDYANRSALVRSTGPLPRTAFLKAGELLGSAAKVQTSPPFASTPIPAPISASGNESGRPT